LRKNYIFIVNLVQKIHFSFFVSQLTTYPALPKAAKVLSRHRKEIKYIYGVLKPLA